MSTMTTTTNTDATTSAKPETLQAQFRAFALSGLQIGTTMVAALSPAERQMVERAIKAGAHLRLDFGPLPAFEHVHLMLIEREGARHGLASVNLNNGLVQ